MDVEERKLLESEELKNRRRTAIMDSAVSLFDQKSIQDVSLVEIARMAGVSKATIYTYFESKEDLLFSLILDTPSWFNRINYNELNENCSGYEGIRQLFQISMENYEKDIQFKHLLMSFDQIYTHEYPAKLESCRKWLERKNHSIEFLESLVVKGMNDGSLKPDLSPRIVTNLIINIIRYFGGNSSVRREVLTADQGSDPLEGYKYLIKILLAHIKL